MKRSHAVPILLLVVLVICTGCDPLGDITQKDLEATLDAPVLSLIATSATAITVEWQPVFGATSYVLIIQKVDDTGSPVGTPVTVERTASWLVSNSMFSEGYFVYTVKKLEGLTNYQLSLAAKRNTTVSASSNMQQTTTKDPFATAPDIAPDAYLQSFDTNTATIYLNPIPGITNYRITYAPVATSGGIENAPVSKDIPNVIEARTYTIDSLADTKNYTIRVYAAVVVNNSWDISLEYTQLDLVRNSSTPIGSGLGSPQFSSSSLPIVTAQAITFDVTPGLTGSDKYLVLLRKDSVNGEFAAVAWKSLASKVDNISDSYNLQPGTTYYYALCNIEATSTTAPVTARSVLSPTIQVNSPIKMTATTTPNSITVSWPELAGDITYGLTVNGNQVEASSDDIVTQNGTCSLTYGSNAVPLVSDSTYAFALTATTETNLVFTGSVSATTGSWAGIYRWSNTVDTTGNQSNFVVSVSKNVTSGSIYPYYMFVNPRDAAYNGTAYRIMPLIDPASDTDVPSGYIPYGSTSTAYENAYRWNEQKWNTTSMKPTSWMIGTAPTASDMQQNIYSVIVNTKAAGMSLQTSTVFQFQVIDGIPVLLFTNKGIGKGASMVNLGLYKNPKPNVALGEGDYTYALKYVGEN